MEIERQPLNPGIRWIGILALLGLFGAWIWLSHVMVSLALDYPIRRAGESAEYPARGTPAFYWNCIYRSAQMLGITVFYWGIPALLAFWLPVKVFPRLRGLRYWLVGLAGVLLPVIGWICYELFTLTQ